MKIAVTWRSTPRSDMYELSARSRGSSCPRPSSPSTSRSRSVSASSGPPQPRRPSMCATTSGSSTEPPSATCAHRVREALDLRHAVLEQVADALGAVLEQRARRSAPRRTGRAASTPMLRQLGADLGARPASALVDVRRRHPDVDDGHVGLVLAHLAQQLLGVAGLADDLEARVLEQPDRARAAAARESSAITTRMAAPLAARFPRRQGCRRLSAPAERADAVRASPRRPLPRRSRIRRRRAVVADLDDERVVGAARTDTLALARVRVAGDVGQRLGRRRSRPRPRRAPAAAPRARARASPARARVGRAPTSAGSQAALGQHGRDGCRARARAARRVAVGEILERLVEQLTGRELARRSSLRAREPQRQREADEVLLRAVVEVALEPPARIVGGGRRSAPARRAAPRSAAMPLGDVAQVADEDRVGPGSSIRVIVSSPGNSLPSRRTARRSRSAGRARSARRRPR